MCEKSQISPSLWQKLRVPLKNKRPGMINEFGMVVAKIIAHQCFLIKLRRNNRGQNLQHIPIYVLDKNLHFTQQVQ